MKDKKNQPKLKSLMTIHQINCVKVSELLKVKAQTVRVWRCESGMDIPDNMLELLEFKVKE